MSGRKSMARKVSQAIAKAQKPLGQQDDPLDKRLDWQRMDWLEADIGRVADVSSTLVRCGDLQTPCSVREAIDALRKGDP
jgi:hypothetical protein